MAPLQFCISRFASKAFGVRNVALSQKSFASLLWKNIRIYLSLYEKEAPFTEFYLTLNKKFKNGVGLVYDQHAVTDVFIYFIFINSQYLTRKFVFKCKFKHGSSRLESSIFVIYIEVYDHNNPNIETPIHKISISGWKFQMTGYESTSIYHPILYYDKHLTFTVKDVFTGMTEIFVVTLQNHTPQYQANNNLKITNLKYIPFDFPKTLSEEIRFSFTFEHDPSTFEHDPFTFEHDPFTFEHDPFTIEHP
ncbi:hypothetical protein RF11_00437 [Thelohanellus kitauei]|uniref:Uncharacterized protein n=1 Tax=Thelohanellus kitauei TaxID=669202 RepID=A0A0C2JJC8_THEKT|nr:hypothetical protein RF11_00437 [Thelohanellus kitauei]